MFVLLLLGLLSGKAVCAWSFIFFDIQIQLLEEDRYKDGLANKVASNVKGQCCSDPEYF